MSSLFIYLVLSVALFMSSAVLTIGAVEKDKILFGVGVVCFTMLGAAAHFKWGFIH